MTSNQVAYYSAVETKRHNQEMEAQQSQIISETNRHNMVYEAETERSNRAKEAETYRSNVVNANLENKKILESQRHNKVSEKQEDRRQTEVERHNVRTEFQTDRSLAETERHNRADEDIRYQANEINAINAGANVTRAHASMQSAYASQLSSAAAQQSAAAAQITANANMMKAVTDSANSEYQRQLTRQQTDTELFKSSLTSYQAELARQDYLNYGNKFDLEKQKVQNTALSGIFNAFGRLAGSAINALAR